MHNFGAGDLLEIMPDKGVTLTGKSVMVPFSLIDVPEVDLGAGQVQIATLDLWADESGAPEQD